MEDQMLLLSAAVAAGFVCVDPRADDGATLRCGGRAAALHLAGIAAPPSARTCRPGEDCSLDPGIGARQQLQSLVGRGDVVCMGAGPGSARCYAGGIDLSCAMLESGNGKPKGRALGCPTEASRRLSPKSTARAFMQLPPLWRWVPLYLLVMNVIAYVAFIVDLERARTGINRIAKAHLIGLLLLGGGIGGAAGHRKLADMPGERGFAVPLCTIIGLQFGIIAGVIMLDYVRLPA
jgi:uncharacterized membrane protein YsdA (DUF1294 family)